MMQFNRVKTFQIQLGRTFSVVASAARTSVNAFNHMPLWDSIESRFGREAASRAKVDSGTQTLDRRIKPIIGMALA
jgi:hypothetical protein